MMKSPGKAFVVDHGREATIRGSRVSDMWPCESNMIHRNEKSERVDYTVITCAHETDINR